MIFKTLLVGSIALALPAAAVPASAHHSYAMFDADKLVTVEGTVKTFQWTNPHSSIVVMVPDAKGQPARWPVEMGPVGILAGQGWSPKTVVPGDKVAVTLHPMKDGRLGGEFIYVKLPNGKLMGDLIHGKQSVSGNAPANVEYFSGKVDLNGRPNK